MQIKFMFEYGAVDSCIWNIDPESNPISFGSLMDLDDFPISEKLKAKLIQMCEEIQTSLDWEYPPDPSPWTKEHREDFTRRAKEAYDEFVSELGDGYEVIIDEWWAEI